MTEVSSYSNLGIFFTLILFYFQSETGPNYYKEVPLSEILSVEKSNGESGEPVFCFAIKTASVVFLVGEDSATSDVSVRHQEEERDGEKIYSARFIILLIPEWCRSWLK